MDAMGHCDRARLEYLDPALQLKTMAGGVYLQIKFDPAWTAEEPRKVVTSAVLGKAVIPDLPYEQPGMGPQEINVW